MQCLKNLTHTVSIQKKSSYNFTSFCYEKKEGRLHGWTITQHHKCSSGFTHDTSIRGTRTTEAKWCRLSTHTRTRTHKQAQYATMTTYAMVMQASRTTCDLRSLTPMIKLGSRTLSCWGKSSRSAAPFMIKARNSLNWNTKADHHHNSAVLAGMTQQEWPEPRGSRAGKYTQSHPWFSLLQSPVVWHICLSKTNSLLFPPFPCLFLGFFLFFLLHFSQFVLLLCWSPIHKRRWRRRKKEKWIFKGDRMGK